MDFVYAREAFRSLANYFERRRFFVRRGDGDVIISSLMPRTTKRPNQTMERTTGSPEEMLKVKLESRKQKRKRRPASRRSSCSR